MGYSIYYNGEIDISPKLSEKDEARLQEALRKNTLAQLGITSDDERDLYHGCDWRLCNDGLSIEGSPARIRTHGWGC